MIPDNDLSFFTLAQADEALPLPTDGAAGTTAAPGANPASGNGGGGGFNGMFMFLIIGMIVLMIVMTTFGRKKEEKRRNALIESIKKHDTVQTIGGVIGSVVDLQRDRVVLKVDESSNTRVTFAKSAVQTVLSQGRTTGSASERSSGSASEVAMTPEPVGGRK